MRHLVLLSRGATQWPECTPPWPAAPARLSAALVFLALPFLGGCLAHPLMRGCGGGMGHVDHAGDANHGEHAASAALVKEVQRDDLTVTLEVPPLRAGEAAFLTVRVHDSQTGEPQSGALVLVVVRALEPPAREDAEGASPATAVPRQSEGGGRGVYQLTHRFEEAGRYEILAKVQAGDEGLDRPPVVVVVEQHVAPESPGAGRFKTPMLVLGSIGMALMMGFMLLR